MKSDTKRANRAANDITAKLDKFISGLRPAIQAKYQLSEYMLELAITKGVGLASVACAERCNVLSADETPTTRRKFK